MMEHSEQSFVAWWDKILLSCWHSTSSPKQLWWILEVNAMLPFTTKKSLESWNRLITTHSWLPATEQFSVTKNGREAGWGRSGELVFLDIEEWWKKSRGTVAAKLTSNKQQKIQMFTDFALLAFTSTIMSLTYCLALCNFEVELTKVSTNVNLE